VIVYRLNKIKHRASAFSGEGSRLSGYRWNSAGVALIYTTSSLSLALLEILVQGLEPEQFKTYEGISALVPEDSLEVAKLPSDWRSYPHPASTKRYGDEWVNSKRSLVLRVPSAVNPLEFNYLINPEHSAFAKVEIHKPFALEYDPRVLELLHHLSETKK
jgi:RES domain-containing protein